MEENIYNLAPLIEAVLFASGDPVPAERIALAADASLEAVFAASEALAASYEKEGRGIRILRLGDKLQMCSAPEYAAAAIRVLEQRRPPRLSPAALETLAVCAYFQPVTRAYIDRIRGVDSSYTVSVLIDKGLIEICGHLDTPGRPAIYRTSDAFLRTFGIENLGSLPKLPELGTDEGIIALQNAVDALRASEGEQLRIEEQ